MTSLRELAIIRAPPGATIQDAGRPGKLSWGIPPSGPLDPTAHAAANLAVGNPSGAAAIEVPLGSFSFEARSSIRVSIDGEPVRVLDPGHALVVPSVTRAVRYVAVHGGVDVPVVLGARATLIAAGLGGLDGRALRNGDVLSIGSVPSVEARTDRAPVPRVSSIDPDPGPTVSDPPDPAIFHVMPGPHLERFAAGSIDALMEKSWRVSRLGDRIGVRLDGEPLTRDGRDLNAPAPMIRGAIQVTTDGTLVILGPDHPTTGGYPVIAVLGRAAQTLLARLRPGRLVRFAIVPPPSLGEV